MNFDTTAGAVRPAALAASVLLTAGVSMIAMAPPASAGDSVTDGALGTYQLAWKGKDPNIKWVLTPCDDDAPQCVKVSQYGINDTTMKKAAWSANAYWTVGYWTMTFNYPQVFACPDNGPKLDLPTTFAWDDTTFAGNRSFIEPGICHDKPTSVVVDFTLTKVGPAAPAPAAPAPAAPVPAVPAPAAPAPVALAPGAAEAPAFPAGPAMQTAPAS
jgi:hypothetical protein